MAATATATPTQTFLLDRGRSQWFTHFAFLRPQVLTSPDQMSQRVGSAGQGTLWISKESCFIENLLQCAPRPIHALGDALLLFMPTATSISVLSGYFHHAVFGPSENFLPPEEIGEVLTDDRKADLVIGGIVDSVLKNLILWRGSFEPLHIPFAAFAPSGDGVVPDFDNFRVTDYGQTIQLGPYEAATEALLYEFDPNYRRRIKKEHQESERSFGAALRRLRKQRGLRRKDFDGLSEKEVGRIERGEILPEHLHARTWEILSQKLGVKPEEIETF